MIAAMTTKPHRLGPQTCPHCAAILNACVEGGHDPVAPRRGDLSICSECGGIAVFTRGLRFRAPTPAERREAMADDQVRELQRQIREQKPGDT